MSPNLFSSLSALFSRSFEYIRNIVVVAQDLAICGWMFLCLVIWFISHYVLRFLPIMCFDFYPFKVQVSTSM
jgi:hypothetical protein